MKNVGDYFGKIM